MSARTDEALRRLVVELAASGGISAEASAGILALLPQRVERVVLAGNPARGVVAVARAYGLTSADRMGRSRRVVTSEARQVAMLALAGAGYRQVDIAGIFGRDHATISYGLRRALSATVVRGARGSEALRLALLALGVTPPAGSPPAKCYVTRPRARPGGSSPPIGAPP